MLTQVAVNWLATALTLLLSSLFLMVGTMKLTPTLSPAVHDFLKSEFVRYVPALYLDKVGMDEVALRVLVGTVEVFAAVLLFTPQGVLAAVVLKLLMLGAIFTHVRLNEPPYAPMLVFLLLFVLTTLRTKLKAGLPPAPPTPPQPAPAQPAPAEPVTEEKKEK